MPLLPLLDFLDLDFVNLTDTNWDEPWMLHLIDCLLNMTKTVLVVDYCGTRKRDPRAEAKAENSENAFAPN